MDFYELNKKFSYLLESIEEAIIPSQLSPEGASKVGQSRRGYKKLTQEILAKQKKIVNFHTMSPMEKERVRKELGFGKKSSGKQEGGYEMVRGSMIDPNTLIELFWDYNEIQNKALPEEEKVRNFIYIPSAHITKEVFVDSFGVADGSTHSELQDDTTLQNTFRKIISHADSTGNWEDVDMYHGRIATIPKEIDSEIISTKSYEDDDRTEIRTLLNKKYSGKRIMAMWEDTPIDILHHILDISNESVSSIHMPTFQS